MLDMIAPQISREQVFLADFLQISDATLTFADYIGLENYLRRKATAAIGELKQSTIKLIRGAMDLIFGFLGDELKNWIDGALERDPQSVSPVTRSKATLMEATELGKSSEFSLLSNKLRRRLMRRVSCSRSVCFRSNISGLWGCLRDSSYVRSGEWFGCALMVYGHVG